MESEVAEAYRSSLKDLSQNSKPLINMLTMLADDHEQHAALIIDVIEDHIQKVKPSLKLPVLYLVDSIIKNLQTSTYRTMFPPKLVKMFCETFEKVDEKTRQAMFKLRQTWTNVIPNKKLYAIDVRVNTTDPAWPITATPPEQGSIHVNPKFLVQEKKPTPAVSQPTSAEALMRQQLFEKQQELQKLKLELELAETTAKLEQQRKQLEMKKSNTAPATASVVPVTKAKDPRVAARDPRRSRDPRKPAPESDVVSAILTASKAEPTNIPVQTAPPIITPFIPEVTMSQVQPVHNQVYNPGYSVEQPPIQTYPTTSGRFNGPVNLPAQTHIKKDTNIPTKKSSNPNISNKNKLNGPKKNFPQKVESPKKFNSTKSNKVETPPKKKTELKDKFSLEVVKEKPKIDKNKTESKPVSKNDNRSSDVHSIDDRNSKDRDRGSSRESDRSRNSDRRSSDRRDHGMDDRSRYSPRSNRRDDQKSRSSTSSGSRRSNKRDSSERSSRRSRSPARKLSPRADQERNSNNLKSSELWNKSEKRQTESLIKMDDERKRMSPKIEAGAEPDGFPDVKKRRLDISADNTDSKKDISDLFGSEDIDYRTAPSGIPFKSPGQKGWAKFKENHPENYQQEIDRRRSHEIESGHDVDLRRRPSHPPPAVRHQVSVDMSAQIPDALTLDNQEVVLKVAEQQLKAGAITHQQHQDVLRQLSILYDAQRMQQQKSKVYNEGENQKRDEPARKNVFEVLMTVSPEHTSKPQASKLESLTHEKLDKGLENKMQPEVKVSTEQPIVIDQVKSRETNMEDDDDDDDCIVIEDPDLVDSNPAPSTPKTFNQPLIAQIPDIAQSDKDERQDKNIEKCNSPQNNPFDTEFDLRMNEGSWMSPPQIYQPEVDKRKSSPHQSETFTSPPHALDQDLRSGAPPEMKPPPFPPIFANERVNVLHKDRQDSNPMDMIDHPGDQLDQERHDRMRESSFSGRMDKPREHQFEKTDLDERRHKHNMMDRPRDTHLPERRNKPVDPRDRMERERDPVQDRVDRARSPLEQMDRMRDSKDRHPRYPHNGPEYVNQHDRYPPEERPNHPHSMDFDRRSPHREYDSRNDPPLKPCGPVPLLSLELEPSKNVMDIAERLETPHIEEAPHQESPHQGLPREGPPHIQGPPHRGSPREGPPHHGPPREGPPHHGPRDGPPYHGPPHDRPPHLGPHDGPSHHGHLHEGPHHGPHEEPQNRHQGPPHHGPSHQGPDDGFGRLHRPDSEDRRMMDRDHERRVNDRNYERRPLDRESDRRGMMDRDSDNRISDREHRRGERNRRGGRDGRDRRGGNREVDREDLDRRGMDRRGNNFDHMDRGGDGRPDMDRRDRRIKDRHEMENDRVGRREAPEPRTKSFPAVLDPRWSTCGAYRKREKEEIIVNNQPFELFKGSEPKSITMSKNTHYYYADPKLKGITVDEQLVYNFGEPPKEVKLPSGEVINVFYLGRKKELWIDGTRQEVRVDSPPKKITLNGKDYGIQIDGSDMMILIDRLEKGSFGGPPREILVDGVPHDLRFEPQPRQILVDGQPCDLKLDRRVPVLVINGEPRMVRFDGPPRIVCIDDKRYEVKVDFPSKIRIGVRPCFIALGGPGHELIINGKWHEIKFDGIPKEITVNDCIHTCCLEGPVPQLKILDVMPDGFEEVLLSQTRLSLNYTNPIPPNSDRNSPNPDGRFAGPQQMVPGGPPGPMGPRPLGPPGQMVPGQMGPGPMGPGQMVPPGQMMPPGQMIRPGQRMMGPGPQGGPGMFQPGPQQMMGPVQTQPMPMGPGMFMNPMQNPGAMGMNQMPVGNVMQPMNAGFNQQPFGGMPGNPPATQPASSVVNVLSMLMPNASQPSQSSSGTMDISSLFSKLVAAGIVPTSEQNKTTSTTNPTPTATVTSTVMNTKTITITTPSSQAFKLEPEEVKEVKEKIEPIPDLTDLNTKSLKKYYKGAIQRLYSGIQCSTCGTRFVMDDTDRYREHLDWHFRQNKRGKDEFNMAKNRQWHYEINDWILFELIEESEEKSRSTVFENMMNPNDNALSYRIPENADVVNEPPAKQDADNVCCTCGDQFEQFWHEELEDWHLRDALLVNGKYYHPVCFEDARDESVLEPTPTPTESPETNPFFNRQHSGNRVYGNVQSSTSTYIPTTNPAPITHLIIKSEPMVMPESPIHSTSSTTVSDNGDPVPENPEVTSMPEESPVATTELKTEEAAMKSEEAEVKSEEAEVKSEEAEVKSEEAELKTEPMLETEPVVKMESSEDTDMKSVDDQKESTEMTSS
ncbi:hypothetical protein SNE40_015955 [Patella caerulea]|uniref:CID domain-containing protein n=2 Tax=Patella caerulea TaxID=87958 RepID=A0AAN8JB06_PATCE